MQNLNRLTFLVLYLFLVNLHLSGQEVKWLKGIESEVWIAPFSMEANERGIYTAGEFFGRVDFDPGISTQIDSARSYPSAFISQLDSNGNYKGHQTVHYSTSNNTHHLFSREIELDHSGNVLFSCFASDTIIIQTQNQVDTLDPPTSVGEFPHYVVKLNAANEFLWAKKLGSYFLNQHREIVTDQDNNIYVSGQLVDSLGIDVDPGPETKMIYGDDQSYVVKLDSNGNFLNVRLYPINRIRLGIHRNELFILGKYSASIDLKVGSQTRSYIPLGVSNYIYGKIKDSSFQWINSLNFSTYSSIYSLDELTLDHEGALYIAGDFYDTLDVIGDQSSNRLISNSNYDAFMLKTDSTGVIDWSFQFGNQYGNGFSHLAVDHDKNIYVSSISTGSIPVNSDGGNTKINLPDYETMSIIKFDSLRRYQWHKTLDAISRYPFNMHWSPNNELILSGIFENRFILGDTLNASSNTNMYICRIDDCEPLQKMDTLTLCSGDSFFNSSVQLQDSGLNYVNLPANNGCDTLLSVYLNILPAFSDTSYFTICQGDSVEFFDNTYGTEGIFTKTAINQYGCDSNYVAIIEVDSASFQSRSISICEGDTLWVGSSAYTSSGGYLDTLQNRNGCDSILETSLKVDTTSISLLNFEICEGDSLQINDQFYASEGSYLDTLSTEIGCDSILFIQIAIKTTSSRTNQYSICEGEGIQVGTNYYTKSGTYLDTLKDQSGCDSVVTSQISISQNKEYYQKIHLCRGDTFSVGNRHYTQAGFYEHTLKTAASCDSVVFTSISQTQLKLSQTGNQIKVEENDADYQWIDCNSGLIIPNQVAREFDIDQSGNYRVVVEKANCKDSSACFELDYETPYELKVYPNPAVLSFYVEIPSAGQLSLLDSKGKVIHEQSYQDAGKYLIQSQAYASGIYLLRFSGIQGVLVSRVNILGN